MLAPPSGSVLICGAGCFGAATALELLQQTRNSASDKPLEVILLDRGAEPPATDSATSDHNKIVRLDYTDEFYAQLANEAMQKWRTDPLYKPHFHECGVVVAASKQDASGSKYVNGSLAVNLKEQMRQADKEAYRLNTAQDIKRLYGVETGSFEGLTAYYNESGGWADSRQSCVDVLAECRKLGATFIAGEATNLMFEDRDNGKRRVRGVKLRDGREISADMTVLASGAWTSLLLPECAQDLLPTGQVVGTIQLTKQEADMYKDVPVTLLLDTGFYCFPPTHDNIIKFAIHGPGYLNPAPALRLPSTPRTALTPGYENQQVPADAIPKLKAGLERVFPALVNREWLYSRLCWYTDRASGDWLVDWHPEYDSLFLATGGSGHAFIIGKLVVDRIQGKQTREQELYWSFNGCQDRLDKSRGEEILVRGQLELDPKLQIGERAKL
ncbi:hypothetical protein OIV83_003038 [Microbotryomycetes sp. JL201]|nr:hypothetical protein OIV83_003038 [Microbotryomycetes sp. JL201]